MHPIVGDKARLFLYLLAWTPVGPLLALLLVFSAGFAWLPALVLGVPLALLLAFICLSAFFLARAVPLGAGGIARGLATHAVASAVASALFVLFAHLYAEALSAAGAFPGADAALTVAVPLLSALGMLFFLLATAVHYVIIAVEEKRQAETRALELRMLSKEAELKALRAQLQPHFLFNSLNSISALTAADPEGARRMCVLLGDFLRQGLKLGERETIPLREELELLERFLAVEKVRFGSRLSADIRADQDALSCAVPALVLQPLVENAIGHGIATLVDGGVLRVEALRRGGRLKVAISNPRDPDAQRRPGEGVGLDNVKRRLLSLHGRQARVDVSDGGREFRVELELPAVAAE